MAGPFFFHYAYGFRPGRVRRQAATPGPYVGPTTIPQIIDKKYTWSAYGSSTCQEFSLTSFSLSSMYLPDDCLSITAGVALWMLTFLVFLRLARRFEVVPSDAVVAPEAVDVRHGVHPSPERAVPRYQSVQGTGTDCPRDHTHNKARSSLFANLIFVADCMRLWAGSSSPRTTTKSTRTLTTPARLDQKTPY